MIRLGLDEQFFGRCGNIFEQRWLSPSPVSSPVCLYAPITSGESAVCTSVYAGAHVVVKEQTPLLRFVVQLFVQLIVVQQIFNRSK